ncbi:hypothetical protein ACQPW1_13230 [Nocardia sp. CA-128927]
MTDSVPVLFGTDVLVLGWPTALSVGALVGAGLLASVPRFCG